MILRRLSAVLLPVLLLLGMAAPEAAAQKKPKGKGKIVKVPAKLVIQDINHIQNVPPGVVTFTVTCPPGWSVGSYTLAPQSDPATKVVSAVVNAAGTAYTFTLGNAVFPPRTITAVVIVKCIKPAPAAPPKAMIGGAPRIIIRIGPRQQPTGTATCPKGQVPAGDTVEQGAGTTPRLARPSTAGGVGPVQITSTIPSGRSMIFGLRNPGDLEETVTVGANCLRRTFKSHGQTRSIQVKQGVFDVSVPPGDHLFNGTCSGGAILSTGFALPADGRMSFFGASPTPGGVSVKLGNHTTLAESAQLAFLCARGKER